MQAGGHDVEDREQRRAGVGRGAIGEVLLGADALGLGDVLDAIDEHREVLGLGAQDALVEHRRRIVEDSAEEGVHELLGDPVAEPARENGPAFVGEVLDRFEVAIGDQPAGIAFGWGQARPDLGDQQTDVVAHRQVGTDAARRGGPAIVAGEDHPEQRVIEVGERRQGIEWALGQGAFAARAGSRRALAGQRTGELHEQLRQFLVVERAVGGERTHAFFRRVVAAAGEDCRDRLNHRSTNRDAAVEPGAHFGQPGAASIDHVGTRLEVARVLGRLAVDDATVGRADHEAGAGVGGCLDQRLHRRGPLLEANRILGQLLGLGAAQRLEVRDEDRTVDPGKIGLGRLVDAAMNRVVGTLKEVGLAVGHQLDRGLASDLDTKVVKPIGGQHHAGADVVFHLDFVGGDEVLAQLESPPRAALI